MKASAILLQDADPAAHLAALEALPPVLATSHICQSRIASGVSAARWTTTLAKSSLRCVMACTPGWQAQARHAVNTPM